MLPSTIPIKSNPGANAHSPNLNPNQTTTENKAPPKIGNILYRERVGNETVVCADNQFYRIANCPSPSTLTPILFFPLPIDGRPIGKLQITARLANFVAAVYDDDDTTLPFISGSFSRKSRDKLVSPPTPATSYPLVPLSRCQ